MKIEDCKAGTLVIAHKKSYMSNSMKEFMQLSPLGVGTVGTTSYVQHGRLVNITTNDKTFSFYPEDLSEVK